jgi:hypothetical protein
MKTYPGYTIKKIEDELSWRVIREMIKCWNKKAPSFKKMSDNELLANLSQMGLL